MREVLIEILKKFRYNFEQIRLHIDLWFKERFEKFTAIKESLKESSSYTYEHQSSDFGKEREFLIRLHKEIIEQEEHESEDLKILIQNMLDDYDELVRKYRGLVPLDYSTHIIPDKAHAEEGREIEVEVLQFFPSSCQRENIIQHVTEIIKHVQETSYPDTPIWVKVTQHKEK
ncbi:MAG: hypothetical protein D8M57_06795 [Candidatus Scalindua sp. AMX11]|nr:MAG: hypothetical protein DWQ00_14365 [Candidatus Scalindua sp.]NOG85625.1 hypothetical protein [Planctomycetota bacterium]RZV82477.1 MAG: hypothetical protein EX341_09940 [Candidatus Scalindua sp. SCAELEC01]TDE65597.1 MAG: hypothetical protein D8M57_06795 [Candidatus Scalindua sp. AMX11]GJQ59208.1 MAG: hypothetical protein SCALA701_20090 [Candidatus Scalindua sp.]